MASTGAPAPLEAELVELDSDTLDRRLAALRNRRRKIPVVARAEASPEYEEHTNRRRCLIWSGMATLALIIVGLVLFFTGIFSEGGSDARMIPSSPTPAFTPAPVASSDSSQRPTTPEFNATKAGGFCFRAVVELEDAVREYVQSNRTNGAEGTEYGWPIGAWCITPMETLFEIFFEVSGFNEALDEWDVSNVVSLVRVKSSTLLAF